MSLVETCGSGALASVISIVKKILNLIQLMGPILAIIGLTIILVKLVSNPDNKKLKNAFKNWLIALLMVFFVPIIVNVVMSFFDDSFSFAACWNYADSYKINGDSSYIDPNGDDSNNSVLGDPDLYDSGDGSSGTSSENPSSNVSKLIFVGDSRTVGMSVAVSSNDVWSAKSSMGLDWMKSTGIPNIEGQISSGSGVIILMGVNDLYQPSNYVSYINSKVDKWTNAGAKVYFVSVMPTAGSYENLNTEIDAFNNNLKTNLSKKVKFIDANSYLKSNGFTTTDGLHYTNDTYKKVYNYIKTNI